LPQFISLPVKRYASFAVADHREPPRAFCKPEVSVQHSRAVPTNVVPLGFFEGTGWRLGSGNPNRFLKIVSVHRELIIEKQPEQKVGSALRVQSFSPFSIKPNLVFKDPLGYDPRQRLRLSPCATAAPHPESMPVAMVSRISTGFIPTNAQNTEERDFFDIPRNRSGLIRFVVFAQNSTDP